MSYYKRKNTEQGGLSLGRAGLAVLMLVMLIGGILGRDALRSAFFGTPDVNVTGQWLGIITEDYDAQIRYEYRLTFNQLEDGTIAGQMHLQSTNRNDEIDADSIVNGAVRGDAVSFHEVRVTFLDGVPSYNWCMISVTLDHEVINGQETMTGTWTGIETPGVGSCEGIDGRIILTREP